MCVCGDSVTRPHFERGFALFCQPAATGMSLPIISITLGVRSGVVSSQRIVPHFESRK